LAAKAAISITSMSLDDNPGLSDLVSNSVAKVLFVLSGSVEIGMNPLGAK
jgi:hypothetical protein